MPQANQARITTFLPCDDPATCLMAEDVVTFALAHGLWRGAPTDPSFSFSDVYDPVTVFGAPRASHAPTTSTSATATIPHVRVHSRLHRLHHLLNRGQERASARRACGTSSRASPTRGTSMPSATSPTRR